MAYPNSPSTNHPYPTATVAGTSPPTQRLRQLAKQRFAAELSQCLYDFVIQLLPTQEELAVKEDVRKLLERLIRTIEPDSRLLSFGSTANGFSLRNSDMDLCCLIDSKERLAASDLVTMLGDLLERETKFHVKPLPHARIPIVKLSLDPSPGLPLGIACDIGFENRLALENTRLLMCYAMIDPTRVRTMVLFLKVWSKRRKINSPYKGTLSSYGYVLLVIYFLVHVKNPPVLPNLQQMPPLRPIPKEETYLGEHNTWFFDDIDLLRQRWHSENTETVAELLIDFFRYFSRDFLYTVGVASIRAGLLKKESKGWQSDPSASRYNDARERNRFCIEDPFETDYNVARCVTKDGLYTIRGEFMRASRVLANRPERAILVLADLCEERKDEDLVTAPPFASARQVPPQTPYSVGSRSMRSNKGSPIIPSPTIKLHEPGPSLPQQVPIRPPPEHMAPKRSQWTSPPPPEAPSSDHTLFESQLGMGLELATAATEAREKEEASTSSSSSSSNSEILDDYDEDLDLDRRSDAAESDDVTSIRSFTEGTTSSTTSTTNSAGPSFRRPSWLVHASPNMRAQVDFSTEPPSWVPKNRFNRPMDISSGIVEPSPPHLLHNHKSDSHMRRSSSGPGSTTRPLPPKGHSPLAVSIPLPPSPDLSGGGGATSFHHRHHQERSESVTTVYYETRSPHTTSFLYPSPGPSSPLSPYHTYHHQFYGGHGGLNVPHDVFPSNLPALSELPMPPSSAGGLSSASTTGQMTPTPASVSSHNHSLSSSTITVPTPPPTVSKFRSNDVNNDQQPNVPSSPTVTPPPVAQAPLLRRSSSSLSKSQAHRVQQQQQSSSSPETSTSSPSFITTNRSPNANANSVSSRDNDRWVAMYPYHYPYPYPFIEPYEPNSQSLVYPEQVLVPTPLPPPPALITTPSPNKTKAAAASPSGSGSRNLTMKTRNSPTTSGSVPVLSSPKLSRSPRSPTTRSPTLISPPNSKSPLAPPLTSTSTLDKQDSAEKDDEVESPNPPKPLEECIPSRSSTSSSIGEVDSTTTPRLLSRKVQPQLVASER